MTQRVLKMGMVGGGRGAFIGAVHRTAANLDNGVRFTAGALSSTSEKAIASGKDLGLEDRRNYSTWAQMLEGEQKLPPGERIDFVSIVTPNNAHFPVAKAFAQAGFNVVCDKPMVVSSEQARELIATVEKAGVVFGVTYNYSGYPMVKQARSMIAGGAIGVVRKVVVEYNQGWLASALEQSGQKQADWRTDPARSGLGGAIGVVRKVVVEYNQGWLASALEQSGQKQADWRTDPARSGLGGAIGDIGSHAEQLASYTTGLELDAICADLTTFVPGRKLDDDANVLLRFKPKGGTQAKGVLMASQVEVGHENDLRLRVFGTTGSLDWRQEDPNALVHRLDGQPERVLRRGNGYLCDAAKANTRLPAGHPEAFFEAFANVYNAVGQAIRAGGAMAPPKEAARLGDTHEARAVRLSRGFDFPTVVDGARGVHFIEKCVASSASGEKWTPASFDL